MRIDYMDVAKCFAIFLMILGHAFWVVDHDFEKLFVLRRFIYSFHMPLFILISGFFAGSSFNRPWKDFLWRKFKGLILPVFAWTLMVCSLMYVNGEGKKYILGELVVNSWFLKTLFVLYVTFYLSKKFLKSDMMAFLISAGLLYVIPHGSTLQISYLYLIFWVGYFFRKHIALLEKHVLSFFLLSLMLSIVSYALYLYFDVPDYIHINPNSIISQGGLISLNYLTAISLSMFVIAFSYVICRFLGNESKLVAMMKRIGIYTLGLYLTQEVVMLKLFYRLYEVTIRQEILQYNLTCQLIVSIIISIIIIALEMPLIRMLSKNRLLGLVLYGGAYSDK